MKVNEIAKGFAERYPKMKIEDLAKFFYLGTIGNSHIMEDVDQTKRKLSFELLSVIAREDEPMYEEISPNGDMVKLNLRHYKEKNGTSDLLLAAMAETSESFEPDKDKFLEICNELLEMTKNKELPFTQKSVKEFIKKVKDGKFEPIHHSKEFEEEYKPAYRIIKKSIFDEKISLYLLD